MTKTGRPVRGDKRGSIPESLKPILARLDISQERWLACMLGWRQFRGAVVGGVADSRPTTMHMATASEQDVR